jgi:hypothetical protein
MLRDIGSQSAMDYTHMQSCIGSHHTRHTNSCNCRHYLDHRIQPHLGCCLAAATAAASATFMHLCTNNAENITKHMKSCNNVNAQTVHPPNHSGSWARKEQMRFITLQKGCAPPMLLIACSHGDDALESPGASQSTNDYVPHKEWFTYLCFCHISHAPRVHCKD